LSRRHQVGKCATHIVAKNGSLFKRFGARVLMAQRLKKLFELAAMCYWVDPGGRCGSGQKLPMSSCVKKCSCLCQISPIIHSACKQTIKDEYNPLRILIVYLNVYPDLGSGEFLRRGVSYFLRFCSFIFTRLPTAVRWRVTAFHPIAVKMRLRLGLCCIFEVFLPCV
jgi:hypothetical protein